MEQDAMTVQELIAKLRLCDPNAIVLVDHVRDFVPVLSVESFIVWQSDNDLFPYTYVNNLQRGLRCQRAGGARTAIYLNSTPSKVGE